MTCPRCEGSVLELQDVWFSYGNRPVLEGVTLKVPAGSFAALIGPNGAGKSTLLRLLLGIVKPHRGVVSLFGKDPGKHGQPIGYVPQGINLPRGFPLSVQDVVLMGRYGNLGPIRRPSKDDRARVGDALGQVGMEHLPKRRFEDLSGGQQQRVLIARALVGEPCLLILDEPTSGLDPAARASFYGLICDLQRARGLTLFCASHDVEDVAQHAQTLFLLDHSIKASGPPQEVLESQAVPSVYHFPPPHIHKEPSPAVESGDQGDGTNGRGPLLMEFLSYGFIQRALLTGFLLGATCAVLGVFVVLKRMAFIGVGISHAALGGVALGLVLGVPPLAAAGVFSVGVAWVIGWITRKGEVSEDTAIGIFFPTAMAMGVALISLSETYRQDLMGYLFGNILSVRPEDLWGLLILAAGSLGVLALLFKEFLFLGVDEEAAKAAGLPAAFLNYLLLSILAVTIVAAMKLVGIVLVSAFLVIPAATGQALASSVRGMVVISVTSALVSVGGGLWLSWLWSLPSGASIVLFAAALFFVSYLLGTFRTQH